MLLLWAFLDVRQLVEALIRTFAFMLGSKSQVVQTCLQTELKR